MTVESSALVFAVSLLVGGFAIAIGARAALTSEDYSHAVLTALLGALAWAAVDAVFTQLGAGGVLASLVGLFVWIGVIRWRYDVGWLRGALIGFVAWLAALVALAVLALVGVGALDAYGVPGT